MSGIYIHIPFCRSACHYCDFHFSTSMRNLQIFLEALDREIEMQKDYLEGRQIQSLYFGGGTPSVLDAEMIVRIIQSLSRFHDINSDAEITLEANPDDLNPDYLLALRSTPVNRLSIGVQSFHDDDLCRLNRTHTGRTAEKTVLDAAAAGFQNISIDLMYGLPELSNSQWSENLERACRLPVQHISAYCLTIEPQTVFGHRVRKGVLPPVDEDRAANQFDMCISRLSMGGFTHYEISNFCLPDFHSRHNMLYWSGEPYLGLGPSAHSFNGRQRQWNVSNNNRYFRSMINGQCECEKEQLCKNDLYNEYVMTSLRTAQGANIRYIGEKFGSGFFRYFQAQVQPYIIQGMMQREENCLLLTPKGMRFADRIAADLFRVEDDRE